MRIILALCLALGLGHLCSADTHYAARPDTNPWVRPAFPYTSRETAASYIMDAVGAADAGDTVVVLPGRYGWEGARYRLKDGVDLIGSGAEFTVMLGDLTVGRGAMVSGFRFEDCHVEVPTRGVADHCLFCGASLRAGDRATIRYCEFMGVLDGPWDPALEIEYVMGVSVQDCTFEVPAQEVALRAFETADLLVSGCKFSACRTALSWFDGSASARIENCVFIGNREAIRMDVSPVTIVNCTLLGNEWAVWVGWQCDFGPSVTSSILWGSAVPGIFVDRSDGFGQPVVTFSDVEGGYPGQGNIDSDPMFFLPSADKPDLHLCALSPCVDAGDPFSDYSQEPEPNGGRINMGAYGGTWEATTSELVDTDKDNLRDDWEIEHFGTLDRDGVGDADGDGLRDRQEYRHLTDPNNPDTDADTLSDGEEVSLGTSPHTADTDNDGTPDAKEVAQGTDPLDWTDAFTVLDFYIEEGYLYITFPTNPGYEYSLYSSNWPNGPFGFTVSPYQGRYGVLTHTDVLRLGPYNRFFCIKTRKYPGP